MFRSPSLKFKVAVEVSERFSPRIMMKMLISFEMFSSRWTIEILAALYIAGDRRFNELRTLLRGISSRTLSDKLTTCQEHGLVERVVEEGPPIRVTYRLTTHGRTCGRLLGPLVAYMKTHKELIESE